MFHLQDVQDFQNYRFGPFDLLQFLYFLSFLVNSSKLDAGQTGGIKNKYLEYHHYCFNIIFNIRWVYFFLSFLLDFCKARLNETISIPVGNYMFKVNN